MEPEYVDFLERENQKEEQRLVDFIAVLSDQVQFYFTRGFRNYRQRIVDDLEIAKEQLEIEPRFYIMRFWATWRRDRLLKERIARIKAELAWWDNRPTILKEAEERLKRLREVV